MATLLLKPEHRAGYLYHQRPLKCEKSYIKTKRNPVVLKLFCLVVKLLAMLHLKRTLQNTPTIYNEDKAT